MPTRRKARRPQRGKGFMDFLRKANSFLKKNKIISRVGSALGSIGVPYASTIGTAAGAVGYGRRRRRVGMGIGRTGSGLRRSGAGHCGKH
jgi:hypothetical protein